jgi:hypothetical protein
VPTPEGVLRVRTDVVLQSATREHVVILSADPGVLGELVSLQSPDTSDAGVLARVLESQLIVVDGTVKHQLRLHQMDGTVSPGLDDDRETRGGTSADD